MPAPKSDQSFGVRWPPPSSGREAGGRRALKGRLPHGPFPLYLIRADEEGLVAVPGCVEEPRRGFGRLEVERTLGRVVHRHWLHASRGDQLLGQEAEEESRSRLDADGQVVRRQRVHLRSLEEVYGRRPKTDGTLRGLTWESLPRTDGGGIACPARPTPRRGDACSSRRGSLGEARRREARSRPPFPPHLRRLGDRENVFRIDFDVTTADGMGAWRPTGPQAHVAAAQVLQNGVGCAHSFRWALFHGTPFWPRWERDDARAGCSRRRCLPTGRRADAPVAGSGGRIAAADPALA